jgi:hypothetical protein
MKGFLNRISFEAVGSVILQKEGPLVSRPALIATAIYPLLLTHGLNSSTYTSLTIGFQVLCLDLPISHCQQLLKSLHISANNQKEKIDRVHYSRDAFSEH